MMEIVENIEVKKNMEIDGDQSLLQTEEMMEIEENMKVEDTMEVDGDQHFH